MNRTLLFAVALATAGSCHAATVSRQAFGTTPGGEAVEAVTLRNAHGMTVRVLSLGALIQTLEVPDARGHSDDVVLGYDGLQGYIDRHNYFGVTVGRYANRIGGGAFVLDGQRYQITRNDGANALHGGTTGFGQRIWTIAEVHSGDQASVTLTLRSPDGDQGFPGTVTASVTYTLGEDNALTMQYRATTDRPTVVNMTNHAYFNLGGALSERGIMDEWLTIPAQHYTPIDAGLIPTGEIRAVAGTPFDFTQSTQIGARIRDGREPQLALGQGYDHNWVVSMAPVATPQLMAHLEDRTTGRVLDVLGTAPGLQFYSGNMLTATIVGKGNRIYRQGDALALEAQLFPDTPNHANFGSARLDPGQVYSNTIVYRFSTVR
jgi:aldose 1-epimerase